MGPTRRLRLILTGLGLLVDGGHWLEADRLLGCAYPRREAALAALAGQGISLLVNLHQRPHRPDRLARHGLAELHLPAEVSEVLAKFGSRVVREQYLDFLCNRKFRKTLLCRSGVNIATAWKSMVAPPPRKTGNLSSWMAGRITTSTTSRNRSAWRSQD